MVAGADGEPAAEAVAAAPLALKADDADAHAVLVVCEDGVEERDELAHEVNDALPDALKIADGEREPDELKDSSADTVATTDGVALAVSQRDVTPEADDEPESDGVCTEVLLADADVLNVAEPDSLRDADAVKAAVDDDSTEADEVVVAELTAEALERALVHDEMLELPDGLGEIRVDALAHALAVTDNETMGDKDARALADGQLLAVADLNAVVERKGDVD